MHAPSTKCWVYDGKQHILGFYPHQAYNLAGKTDTEQVIENMMSNSEGAVQTAWGV